MIWQNFIYIYMLYRDPIMYLVLVNVVKRVLCINKKKFTLYHFKLLAMFFYSEHLFFGCIPTNIVLTSIFV